MMDVDLTVEKYMGRHACSQQENKHQPADGKVGTSAQRRGQADWGCEK